MPRRLFLFIAFACVGITTEIFFTAIVDAINHVQAGTGIDWRLMGKSYIWMFPIYGLAGLLFPLLYDRIIKIPLVLRMCIYGIVILAIEFTTGAILDKLTGQCPWQYTSGWQVMGYIRLDYFPLWAGFGLLIERIYVFLSNLYDHVRA